MRATTIKNYYSRAIEAGKEARRKIEKAEAEYEALKEYAQKQYEDKMLTEKARRQILDEGQAKLQEATEAAQSPLDALEEEYRKAVREEQRIRTDSIDAALMQYLQSGVRISAEEMQELADQYAGNPTMLKYLRAFWEPKATEIRTRNRDLGFHEPFEVLFAKDPAGNVSTFKGFCAAVKSISRSGRIPEQYTRGAVKIKNLDSYYNQRAQETLDYVVLEKGDAWGDLEADFPVETTGSYISQGGLL